MNAVTDTRNFADFKPAVRGSEGFLHPQFVRPRFLQRSVPA